jgi:hypothetical protein
MHPRTVTQRLALLIAACAILAGCAQVKEDVRQIREAIRKMRGREPAPTPPAPPPVAQKPAPGQPPAAGLSVNGNCVARDETGYSENARLEIASGQVRALDATINVPNRGSCHFQLSAFRQTKQSPFVELTANSSAACAVRVWQQGDRVTMAATDCADKCSRGTFDYVWPVEFNTAGGCY